MTVDIHREILGDIVARHPGWTPLLRDFGIDVKSCATLTLAAAADRAEADIDDVVAALFGSDRSRTDCAAIRDAPVRQLVAHLVGVHHAFVGREFPRIAENIEALRRADPDNERLQRIEAIFADVRADMEPHMASEEAGLFPLCVDIADAFSAPSFHTGPVDRPIEQLTHDHHHADSLLADLAAEMSAAWPAGSAEAGSDAVASLRDAVNAVALDLRVHLDEEEDLLFPMVRRLAAQLDQS